jgi:plastocyanin
MVLNPTSGPPGTAVIFDSGSGGWDGNAQVSITFNGTQVATCRTDGGGLLNTSTTGCTFTVPSIAAGTYTVRATETTVGSLSFSASFQVTAATTPTPTSTSLPTVTPSPTSSATATPTVTNSPTNTATVTPTTSATRTDTPMASSTPTATSTDAATATPTATSTDTATPTDTATGTPTATSTDTATPTATSTDTATGTPTATSTDTATGTPTATPTATSTSTPTPSQTALPASITSLSPASVQAGISSFTLTVAGAGFDASDRVTWNGTALPTGLISSSQVSATVDASLASSPQTVDVEVTGAGGTSAPASFYVSINAVSITSSASATSSGGPALADIGGTGAGSLRASTSGSGTISLALFSGNPAGAPSFSSSGPYFDLHLARGGAFGTIVLTDCSFSSGPGALAYWWNGATWAQVTQQSNDGSCISIVIGGATSPSLTDLSGAVFGVGMDFTPTPSATATAIDTSTSTATATATATFSPAPSSTGTPTSTPTPTATASATDTPTATATETPTATATSSATATFTAIPTVPPSAPTAVPGSATVTMLNTFAFLPQTLTVYAGSTVTWINADSITQHTATSTAGLWDSGAVNPGQSFRVSFNTTGTYAYLCTIHPALMTGTVYVLDAPTATVTPTMTGTPAATETATATAAQQPPTGTVTATAAQQPPTETATATATQQPPTETATATATVQPAETATPTSVPPTSTSTATTTATVVATATATITPSPTGRQTAATATAAPAGTATPPSGPDTPTSTPVPNTPTSTPAPTNTPTPNPTATPTVAGGVSSSLIPPSGGMLNGQLSTGQPVQVTLGSDAASALYAIPGVTSVNVLFDPAPALPNASAVNLGGGVASPVNQPIDVQLQLKDAAGKPINIPPLNGALTVDITLPLLSASSGASGVFSWLQAVYDSSGFLGYIRESAEFNPATGMVTIRVPVNALTGTLFLPVIIAPAWVQNFDASAHLYSGPTGNAVDFGLVGRQFTTFTVVGPQVGGRLYVYNPLTANYGWIESAAVGPSGPPS